MSEVTKEAVDALIEELRADAMHYFGPNHETSSEWRAAAALTTAQAEAAALKGERDLAVQAAVSVSKERDALKAENEALREALEPFARYVDRGTCTITMIWQDGEYRSTYTDTLKPEDFFAARTALQEPDE